MPVHVFVKTDGVPNFLSFNNLRDAVELLREPLKEIGGSIGSTSDSIYIRMNDVKEVVEGDRAAIIMNRRGRIEAVEDNGVRAYVKNAYNDIVTYLVVDNGKLDRLHKNNDTVLLSINIPREGNQI